MADHLEIEVKFVVDNPDDLRRQLLDIGARSKGLVEEENLRLDDAAQSLTRRGDVLRLRQNKQSGVIIEQVLTVKSPVAGDDPALQVRRELETGYDNQEMMLAALAVLGYAPYWRYEKRRETFHLNDTLVMLDHLPYGWFLEIEGTPTSIRETAEALGFALEDGLAISYATIFENVGRALGGGPSDLTFAAFENIQVEPWMFIF
jgi:adenylate cyclase class 2